MITIINKLRALPKVLLILAMASVVWILQGERRRIHRLEQAAGMKVICIKRRVFSITVHYDHTKPPSYDVPLQWSDVWALVHEIWLGYDRNSTGSEVTR